MRLWQYAEECEGTEIWDYFKVWRCMREAVCGFKDRRHLKGGLDVRRKAENALPSRITSVNAETRENRLVCAYAYAVNEENAAGSIIIHHVQFLHDAAERSFVYAGTPRALPDTEILRDALAAGGIIGNLIKTKNASISGAECDCQANRQRMFHGGGSLAELRRRVKTPD